VQASTDIALANAAHSAVLDDAGGKLVAWFDAQYFQPGNAPSAWRPTQLEHAFGCGAPLGAIDKTMVAEQYPGGHLDWYSFDVAANEVPSVKSQARRAEFQNTFVRSFLPAPIMFDGMPHPRWWNQDNR
jgi:hypothetical protein